VTSIPDANEVEEDFDVVTDASARATHGLFDALGDPPGTGDPLPPLWHWMAFLPRIAQHEMGADGHPRRGDLFHSDEFPRRMFAGARLSFPGVARVGEPLTRHARVKSVERKSGRSGELLFVTVTIEILRGTTPVILEEQDIVYRPLATGGATSLQTPAPNTEDWPLRLGLPTDPVTLFRYSALTYNAHRIHYDRDYAMQHEGYPGLVVQGPLQAMGLAEVARRHVPHRSVGALSFRAMRPAFDGPSLELCGRLGEQGISLAVLDSSSSVTVSAKIVWRDEEKRRDG
jgi:3-methylfumaryl-CoA hydratase